MDLTEQLELFTLPTQAPRRRSTGLIGIVQLRQDHAVLLAILGLIGLSVVFAMGVERGKQIARVEEPLWVPRAMAPLVPQARPSSVNSKAKPAAPSDGRTNTSDRKDDQGPKSVPGPRPPPRGSGKALASQSRFAVQVVSFSQPKRAHRELQRLQQQGEQAFLVMKHGKTALLVGPFLSRENATAKLASLKPRSQDCFLRSL